MADFHVQITKELNDRIKQYYLSNGLTKSQGIRSLIELGLYNSELNKNNEFNNALLSKIYSKTIYTIDLVEKLYSDLEISNNSNPKDNKVLQEFKMNRYKDRFDD